MGLARTSKFESDVLVGLGLPSRSRPGSAEHIGTMLLPSVAATTRISRFVQAMGTRLSVTISEDPWDGRSPQVRSWMKAGSPARVVGRDTLGSVGAPVSRRRGGDCHWQS